MFPTQLDIFGTLFLDLWVFARITTFLLSRIMLFLYGVWESAQLLRDWSVCMSTNPFLHLYQKNRGHTLSSLWVRRVFQLLQIKFFIAIVHALYIYFVGFLGKSCDEFNVRTVRLRAWIFQLSSLIATLLWFQIIPKFALQIHTFFSSFFLEYICIIARSEKFDYFDPVTKLFFFPVFFLAIWPGLSLQMRVISFAWVETSYVVALFARIWYNLFVDICQSFMLCYLN